MWKQVTTNFCEHPAKFQYNGNFIVERGQKYFTKDMRLNFQPAPTWRKDPFYFNQHGPCVYYESIVIGDCASSQNAAITRLSNSREEKYEYKNIKFTITEEVFRQNQKRTAALFKSSNLYQQIRSVVRETTSMLDLTDRLDDFVKLPHIKRQPRIQSWEKQTITGNHTDRLWLKQIIGKIKRGERAKFKKGKPALSRLINDLGCAASLQGAEITNQIKQLLADNPIFLSDGYLKYVKSPDMSELREAYTNLISGEYDFSMIYHSDDSCIGIQHKKKGYTIYNMDISKCDSSHMEEIFEILLSFYEGHEFYDDLKILIDQLRVALVLNNPGGNEYVRLKSLRPILYSGTTLTTLINNIANILIYYRIRLDRCSTEEEIMLSAAKAGYIVTLEECTEIEKITFLKTFPHIITGADSPNKSGEMAICPALGVAFRASGACKGDLPGRGDIEVRANRFQYGVIHGIFPYSKHPLVIAMRGHIPEKILDAVTEAKVNRDLDLDYKLQGGFDENVFTSAICSRYDCEAIEVEELVNLFNDHRFGWCIRTRLTDAILHLDYGYDLV